MAARGGKKRKLETETASPASSGSLSAYQKRALLLSAFGTKQQQRGVEAKLRQQFSFDSATMSILENTVHDSKQDESTSEKILNESASAEPDSGATNSNPSKNSEGRAEDILPHADLEAETPMDIYPLFDLVPSSVYNLLRQPASKFLELCVRQAAISENTRIPRFVLQQAMRINALESDYLRDRLARTLLYVAVLTRFYTILNNRGADNLNYFLEQSESSSLPRVDDFIKDYGGLHMKSKETRRRFGAARCGFDAATYLFGNGSGKLADMCEVSINQLIAHLRDDFTLRVQCAKQMRAKRCVSQRLRDKMVLRVLALCLHLSDFNMRLDLLQRDLQLGPGRICTLLRLLGCTIKRINLSDKNNKPTGDEVLFTSGSGQTPEEAEIASTVTFEATLTVEGIKNAHARQGETKERLTNSLLRFGTRSRKK